MPKPQSVVSLDPIDRTGKKANSPISRLLKTRWYKGKPMAKTDEFGHYLFVGKQRQGKTTSMIWYYQFLTEKYRKKGYKIHTASNMGFGHHFCIAKLHFTKSYLSLNFLGSKVKVQNRSKRLQMT